MQKYFSLFGVDRAMMAPHYSGRPEQYARAIQLTNLSRIFLAILIIKCGIILVSGDLIMDKWAKIFTIPLLLVTICFLIFTCYLLEKGRDAAGRLVLALLVSIVCIISVILCGGFLGSQFTPILIFPMVLSFCLLAKKQAIWMFMVIIVVPLGVDLAIRWAGMTLPDFTSSRDYLTNQISMMVTLFASVFFCLNFLNKSHMNAVHDKNLQHPAE